MSARCRCECHLGGARAGALLFQWAPATTDPIAALTACDLCASLHAGVWSIYRKPRITRRTWKRDIPQADGNTDEGPETL